MPKAAISMVRAVSALVLLMILWGAPVTVLGQVGGPTVRELTPPLGVSRVGISYLDLRTGKPTPALEVTYYSVTPRIWRAYSVSGVVASARGAFYGYAGLQLRFALPYEIRANPSVSAGLYEQGSGLDLGHSIEFRSELLVEVPVSRRILVSAVVFHLSNAGLGKRNPGTEGVGVGLSIVPDEAILSRIR